MWWRSFCCKSYHYTWRGLLLSLDHRPPSLDCGLGSGEDGLLKQTSERKALLDASPTLRPWTSSSLAASLQLSSWQFFGQNEEDLCPSPTCLSGFSSVRAWGRLTFDLFWNSRRGVGGVPSKLLPLPDDISTMAAALPQAWTCCSSPRDLLHLPSPHFLYQAWLYT